MPDNDLNDTQPNIVPGDTQPNLAQTAGKKKFPFWLPLLVAIVLVALGLLTGYSSGMGLRYSAENTVVNGQVAEQFTLGQQALKDGKYDVAKSHFDYVLRENPNFPGVQSAYADLMLRMQITPTTALTPTPPMTATPDTRSQEDQYKNAQDLMKAGDWNGVLLALDSLRKIAPDYQTTQVDGMYYTALYQRGLSEIFPASCRDTNLNGGINDLTQAEHFGPLDSTALGLRIYSRLYIAGASYWDQDWNQAQDLFSQVKDAFSTLMDSSCATATERWRQATIKVAQGLLDKGDVCGAADQFEAAFTVNSPDNANYDGTAATARDDCNGNNNSSEPSPAETPVGGTETPVNTPEPTLTETPTNAGG
jgi:hypothetical protein